MKVVSAQKGRQGRRRGEAPLVRLAWGLDLVTVLVAGIAAYIARFGLAGPSPDFTGPTQEYIGLLGLGLVLSILFIRLIKVNDAAMLMAPVNRQFRTWAAWSAVFIALIVLGFITKTSEGFSRGWIVLWYSFGIGGLLISNGILRFTYKRLQQAGYFTSRIAILGLTPLTPRLIAHLSDDGREGESLVGVFDDRRAKTPQAKRRGISHFIEGGLKRLIKEVRDQKINEVILAIPWGEAGRIQGVVTQLGDTPVSIHLCPGEIAFDYLHRASVDLFGLNLLNLSERPLSPVDWAVKNIEDRFLGMFFLIFSLPVMAFIAIIIKLTSPGPVFFRQKRHGFNNQVFKVYKFRTMYHQKQSAKKIPQAREDDPRVTDFGTFLRRSSLDELPQLINVVMGEMSLVGPRPHALAHNKLFAKQVRKYFARHNIKPGITGWAQVHGYRGEIKSDEDIQSRVQYDLYYIQNWSLMLDMKILVLTFLRVFFQKTAY